MPLAGRPVSKQAPGSPSFLRPVVSRPSAQLSSHSSYVPRGASRAQAGMVRSRCRGGRGTRVRVLLPSAPAWPSPALSPRGGKAVTSGPRLSGPATARPAQVTAWSPLDSSLEPRASRARDPAGPQASPKLERGQPHSGLTARAGRVVSREGWGPTLEGVWATHPWRPRLPALSPWGHGRRGKGPRSPCVSPRCLGRGGTWPLIAA